MSNILNMIGFGAKDVAGNDSKVIAELPDIFPFPIIRTDFIDNDIITIFKRILTDTLERTYGIPDELQPLLWDSCLASEKAEGLVTIISKAMAAKGTVYLVFNRGLKMVRIATNEEATQIKNDYEKQGSSNIGVALSFKNYKAADMMKLYSALEYFTIASFHKKMNLSNSIIMKLSDLRASVAEDDKDKVLAQATALADQLKKGMDIAIDAKDIVESLEPKTEATDKASAFIDRKRSFYLGLPAAYITGMSSRSLSDSGDSDMKAVERGLKAYYFSIVKPVIETLFTVKTTYKSENNANMTTALQALKDFTLTTEEFLSKENKVKIINKLFDLPEDSVGDEAEYDTPPAQNETPTSKAEA